MYLFRRRKGGGTNACICIGTQSQPFLQNCLTDVYETWQGWSAHGTAHALKCFGQIYPRADPGQGENRWRGPLQESASSDWKATATSQMYSNDLEQVGWSVVNFCSIPKSIFLCVHCSEVSESGLLSLLFSRTSRDELFLFQFSNWKNRVRCKSLAPKPLSNRQTYNGKFPSGCSAVRNASSFHLSRWPVNCMRI